MHDGVIKYRCGFCDDIFEGIFYLKDHEKTCKVKLEIESEMPKFVCPMCGESYMMKRTLDAHMRAHHNTSGKVIQCQYCEKTFPSSAAYSSHKRNHHDPITCAECGKFFKSKILHRNHVILNHTREEDKPYRCTVCPKGFIYIRELNNHMNIHTGARPYQCAYCEKAFADQSTRRQHQRSVHLGQSRNNTKPSEPKQSNN